MSVMRRRFRIASASLAILLTSCGSTPSAPPASAVPTSCQATGLTAASALPTPLPTAGLISGPSFTLAQGQTLSPTGDLTIVTDGDIVIDGTLALPDGPKGSAGVSVRLVSLKGKVTVGPGALIGNGFAGIGNGGSVTLSGVNVDINGSVYGQGGGAGEDQSGAVKNSATGGSGGAGGDVVVCADESIGMGGNGSAPVLPGQPLAQGGRGGRGGPATAVATGNRLVSFSADAHGGSGGPGGNVTMTSRLPNGTVQVFIQSDPVGGNGGMGGPAIANATTEPGEDATAVGGSGGAGGTVLFPNAVVKLGPLGSVAAGGGGDGLTATATGGNARPPYFGAGKDGGNATATGGNGGPPGATPVIPKSTPGGSGSGAAGIATPGSGSSAASSSSKGGSSGMASATGGKNGQGKAPTTVPPSGPATATGTAGASAPAVTAPGEP